MSIEHNVTFNVIDAASGDIVFTHEGHNAATNSLLLGIGHYLVGDGIYNQAYDMLSKYVPRYLSLGTMGLINQNQDDSGLPSGLGSIYDTEESSEIDRLAKLDYGEISNTQANISENFRIKGTSSSVFTVDIKE